MNTKIRINQAKKDTNLKVMKAELMARMKAKIEANQQMMETSQE
jgi:hypothetical protein